MVSWVGAFSAEVRARTGRHSHHLHQCGLVERLHRRQHQPRRRRPPVGGRYASSPGALPAGWRAWRIWQNASSGRLPGDQDTFNGSITTLRRFARGR